MSFFEDNEPEALKQSQTLSSAPLRISAKTQNFVVQTKRTENILIQIAFSIGMGSMWRFPYLCHRNGGGKARHLDPEGKEDISRMEV